jgi:hypothetical protein
VDPTPDSLFLRKSGSAGNRTRTSGSVARYSDQYTTEAGGNIINKLSLNSEVRESERHSFELSVFKVRKQCSLVLVKVRLSEGEAL